MRDAMFETREGPAILGTHRHPEGQQRNLAPGAEMHALTTRRGEKGGLLEPLLGSYLVDGLRMTLLHL